MERQRPIRMMRMRIKMVVMEKTKLVKGERRKRRMRFSLTMTIWRSQMSYSRISS